MQLLLQRLCPFYKLLFLPFLIILSLLISLAIHCTISGRRRWYRVVKINRSKLVKIKYKIGYQHCASELLECVLLVCERL